MGTKVFCLPITGELRETLLMATAEREAVNTMAENLLSSGAQVANPMEILEKVEEKAKAETRARLAVLKAAEEAGYRPGTDFALRIGDLFGGETVTWMRKTEGEESTEEA